MIWEGSATYRKILCFLWPWAPLSSGVWALRGVSIDTQILSSANCAAKSGQGHALSAHPSHCWSGAEVVPNPSPAIQASCHTPTHVRAQAKHREVMEIYTSNFSEAHENRASFHLSIPPPFPVPTGDCFISQIQITLDLQRPRGAVPCMPHLTWPNAH